MAAERSNRSEASKEAAAQKFALLEMVALDDRCSPLMVRIMVIMSALGGERREAFPSYETLAFMTGAAIQNVRAAVERLWSLGYIEAIEKDPGLGRSRVNHYRLPVVPIQQPVWTLYHAWKAHQGQEEADRKEARQRTPFSTPSSPSDRKKEARQRAKEASERARKGMLACLDSLELAPEAEASSVTTVTADAAASASPSKDWKGSKGEPLPAGFPDSAPMEWAQNVLLAEGVEDLFDLRTMRREFRSYHYSVRCLLTDWEQSWRMWVEKAVAEITE